MDKQFNPPEPKPEPVNEDYAYGVAQQKKLDEATA